MKYLVVIPLLFFMACGTTHYVDKSEVVVKYDTVRVPVPIISDSLTAVNDSLLGVIHAERIKGKDTVIQVKYFPKDRKIYVNVKPDTILVPVTDTITVSHTTEIHKEPSWFQENGIFVILILALGIVLLIVIKKVFL